MDVRKIAEESRLELTPEEIEKFEKELEKVREAFSVISSVKASEICVYPEDLEGILRDDEVEDPLPLEDALANDEDVEKFFFRGPKIV